MHEEQHHSTEVSRRVVLRGAAVSGIALPVLAACGSDSGESASDTPTGSESSSPSPSGEGGSESSDAGESPNADESADAGGGGTSVAAADVPVGGGRILADQELVITQPSEGEFMAFSAVCTHQGCLVNEVAGGQINCPCHGSAFSIEDGAVVGGPAEEPLESRSVSVDGDQVVVG